MNISVPLASASTFYFPLRNATNSSQITLGRVFLQEAYITVDWEAGNFSIGQTNAQNSTSHIISITHDNTSSASKTASTPSTSGHSSGISTGTVAGIAVVIVALLAIAGGLGLFYLRRKYRSQRGQSRAETASPEAPSRDNVEHFPPEKYRDEKSPSAFVNISEVLPNNEVHPWDRKPSWRTKRSMKCRTPKLTANSCLLLSSSYLVT
jgi:hypothetical protein